LRQVAVSHAFGRTTVGDSDLVDQTVEGVEDLLISSPVPIARVLPCKASVS
jgi:hypothetical protein